jgi:hypothetical protein
MNYQPAPKWHIHGRALIYYQGLDTLGQNFGGNIFKDYTTRLMENGFNISSGNKINVFNGLVDVSYELRENIFLDISLQHRNHKFVHTGVSNNSTFVSGGIRLNMGRREYDY